MITIFKPLHGTVGLGGFINSIDLYELFMDFVKLIEDISMFIIDMIIHNPWDFVRIVVALIILMVIPQLVIKVVKNRR